MHRAALESGVKRYLVQSTGFFYGPGKGLATEEDPLAHDATPGVADGVATYMQLEKRVLGSRGLDGVALRYGFFYGPGTYHDPQSGSISEQLRRREYPVIDPGTAVSSFIHVEDAAAATRGGVRNLARRSTSSTTTPSRWLSGCRPSRVLSVRLRRLTSAKRTRCRPPGRMRFITRLNRAGL